MRETRRKQRAPIRPKPVQKIELSEKHSRGRLLLAILLFLAGCGAMAWGVSGFLSVEDGWTEISVSSGAEQNCADDFTLLYELGAGDVSAGTEEKQVRAVYTEAAESAYLRYSADVAADGSTEEEETGTGTEQSAEAEETDAGTEQSAEIEETGTGTEQSAEVTGSAEPEDTVSGIANVYTINRNPNTVLEVDERLWQAFSLIQEYGDRKLYLGPVYEMYDDMFFCTDDSQTLDFDPYLNEDVAAYYQKIADFAQDPESVNLELIGENQVRLSVSEEYLAFAEEYGITNFIDFFWMKNAFIADDLADALTEAGFTHGSIASYDGFVRCLDDREGATFSLTRYEWQDGKAVRTEDFVCSGLASVVTLRDYPLSDQDSLHYYTKRDGTIRTSYLDPADGKCKSAVHEVTAYVDGSEAGCAQILLEISTWYISDSSGETDTLPQAAVDALAEARISIF